MMTDEAMLDTKITQSPYSLHLNFFHFHLFCSAHLYGMNSFITKSLFLVDKTNYLMYSPLLYWITKQSNKEICKAGVMNCQGAKYIYGVETSSRIVLRHNYWKRATFSINKGLLGTQCICLQTAHQDGCGTQFLLLSIEKCALKPAIYTHYSL